MRSLLLCLPVVVSAVPRWMPSATSVQVYDFLEVGVQVLPVRGNPFQAASLSGELRHSGEAPVNVMGFCDERDCSTFRIRFMATKPGDYTYKLRYRSPRENGDYSGNFSVIAGKRRGLVRVDPQYASHFIWEGTGEHYFWNGLTTYAPLGWPDESDIHAIVDRAARFKVNRLRVTLHGPRVKDAWRWYEPVTPSGRFRFLFGPWVGANPDNVADPAWDVNRFDTSFWQKVDRVVRYARDRDVVISIIFFLDGEDAGADPFGKARSFGEQEKRYYAYAAARLAAYSNVMWDVTNEWHLFRDAWWVERMGTYLKSVDPYAHLASCHGRGEFPWMLSRWADFAMFQLWDEAGGYEAMLKRRVAQSATGRPMPQVNEEYGYEDHYPVKWGGNRRPPARSADNRRRLAWEISMAGCYQTTGERANRGDGNPPATPGGWINGGFDDSMTMLEGYARMVDFFQSIEYWKLQPTPELASGGLLMLADRGRQYVVYSPHGASGAIDLEPGDYATRWYNPRTGQWSDGPAAHAATRTNRWMVPAASDTGDWVLLISK